MDGISADVRSRTANPYGLFSGKKGKDKLPPPRSPRLYELAGPSGPPGITILYVVYDFMIIFLIL